MPRIINKVMDLGYHNKFTFPITILIYARVFEITIAAVKLVYFFIKNT